MQILDFGANAPNLDAARQQVMLLACTYAYEPVQMADMLGIHGEILLWHFESGTWPPSFVVANTNDGGVLVLIEGTTSITQGVAHYLGGAGRVFIDNVTPVNLIWFAVAERIKALLLPLLGAGWKNLPLRIAGHSYGGALAFLVGCLMKQLGGAETNIQVMTFGEPRSIGSGYAGPRPDIHWRITSTKDIVPLLPPEEPIAYLAQWGMPLNWTLRNPAWKHYGTATMLYASGSTTPEANPDPLAAGVTEAIPDAHYLPNYWARLILNRQRFGGTQPSEMDFKRMGEVLYKFPQIKITPELPFTFTGPDDKRHLIFQGERGNNVAVILQPGLMKHVWNFLGHSGETWSEVYYKNNSGGTNDRAALLAGLPGSAQALITNRLSLLHKGNQLQNITASYVFGNREAVPRTYGLNGLAQGQGDDTGADIAGATAVFNMVGQSGAKRKIWVRGWADSELFRDPLTGRGKLGQPSIDKSNLWISAMIAFGYGILSRVKKMSIMQGLHLQTVNVDGSLEGNWSRVQTEGPHGFADGDQVILAQHSKKDLPGLNGIYTIRVYPTSANSFWIRYVTPSDALVTEGMGYVRPYSLKNLDLFDYTSSVFGYLGTRKTKSPLSRSRAASRAQVSRMSS